MGGAGSRPDAGARRARLRAAALHLVLGVAVVHGVALVLYYALGIATGPDRTRTIFIMLWTFVTALTVAFLLRRVRAARRPTVRGSREAGRY